MNLVFFTDPTWGEPDYKFKTTVIGTTSNAYGTGLKKYSIDDDTPGMTLHSARFFMPHVGAGKIFSEAEREAMEAWVIGTNTVAIGMVSTSLNDYEDDIGRLRDVGVVTRNQPTKKDVTNTVRKKIGVERA